MAIGGYKWPSDYSTPGHLQPSRCHRSIYQDCPTWCSGTASLDVLFGVNHGIDYCGVTRALQWRHNGWDCVLNHQPRECLLNRLFRLRSKKTSKLRVTGFCAGNSPRPVNSPHKWPVTRKMFPFDDVIMCSNSWWSWWSLMTVYDTPTHQ